MLYLAFSWLQWDSFSLSFMLLHLSHSEKGSYRLKKKKKKKKVGLYIHRIIISKYVNGSRFCALKFMAVKVSWEMQPLKVLQGTDSIADRFCWEFSTSTSMCPKSKHCKCILIVFIYFLAPHKNTLCWLLHYLTLMLACRTFCLLVAAYIISTCVVSR